MENPGKPSDLVPIRPLDKATHLTAMELSVEVNGRTLDGDFTLFDVYTEQRLGFGRNRGHIKKYETFITIKTDGQQWPHFEHAPASLAICCTSKTSRQARQSATRSCRYSRSGARGGLSARREPLFDRNALRQIPRLIDIAAASQRDVIREELGRHHGEDRL